MRYADAKCTYTERFKPQHVYVFEGPYLDKPDHTRQVTVKAEELFRYRQGAMIQDAFPNLSADDREFLMSGLSPQAFEEIAKEEDEASSPDLDAYMTAAWKALPEITDPIDAESVGDMLRQNFREGISLEDAIAIAKLTEHVSPHLSEAYACAEIGKIYDKYPNLTRRKKNEGS